MAPFLNTEALVYQGNELETPAVKPVPEIPNAQNDSLKSAEVTDVERLSQIKSKPINYPKSKLELVNRPVDEPRKLRVAVIGAGLTGITAGIFLPAKVPGIELTIFDKNEDVGGTWLENKYPGVRCDIPSHVYQPTFLPNPEWTEKFARGPEILAYWKKVAETNDVYRFIRFNSLIQKAEWDPALSVWQLSILDSQKQHYSLESFDFVLSAIGRFNAWRLPVYPGMDEYGGDLIHSSNWDLSLETSSKRIAVIGNGASGIQLVPELQKVVARLDHYARSPTWIAGSYAGDSRGAEPDFFSSEQLESFKEPDTYLAYRKEAEGKYWRGIKTMDRDSAENADMRADYIKIMRQRLEKKPELLEKLVPSFLPHCRRLTPGPGYLEAICEDNLEYIQTPIRRFTTTGIETVDGTRRDVDAVICATGFNIDFAPPFPIVAYGKDLSEAWKSGGSDGFPKTYLGLAAANFPNFLIAGGPHVTGASGTLNHCVETQLVYHARLLRKVATQHIKTIRPKEQAVEDFIEYADAYFPTTPLVDDCSSWANGGKPGNRIHGAWPGSASHITFIRRDPRWEDWDYEYESSSGNRFAYFGNGRTLREADPASDMTSYLQKPSDVDIRDIHESWHRWP